MASPTGEVQPYNHRPVSQTASPGKTDAMPPPEEPARPPLEQEIELRYRAEIDTLYGIVQHHRLTADADGRNACAYSSEKLIEASSALDRADTDSAWVHLFGVATFCQNSGINPVQAILSLHRIDSLLR